MNYGRKFQITPTGTQQEVLRAWIGHQRAIYNAKVNEARYQRKLRSLALRDRDFCGPVPPVRYNQQYAHFIGEDTPYFKEVPSQLLRNGAYRFHQAVRRYMAGLGGKPVIKKKHGKQSVLITDELFEIKDGSLHIGTQKFPVGVIKINAHLEFNPPKMISVSVDGNRWFVSFQYEDDAFEPSYDALLEEYSSLSKDELLRTALGIDRGVKVNAYGSDGRPFVFSPEQAKSLEAAEARKKRYQRIMNRRFKKGAKVQSKNYYRAKASKQKAERKIRHIRLDFNHKSSHALANNAASSVIVFEKLKLKNMTKSPATQKDESGHYLPNGAKAKAGLNRSVLNVAMGQLIQFTQYKALRRSKLVLEVPAHHTSQMCSRCRYVHKDNRATQADFTCLACGHAEHADLNAAKNIKQRGVELLLSGYFLENKKPKKKVSIRKKTVENSPCVVDAVGRYLKGDSRSVAETQNEALALA